MGIAKIFVQQQYEFGGNFRKVGGQDRQEIQNRQSHVRKSHQNLCKRNPTVSNPAANDFCSLTN